MHPFDVLLEIDRRSRERMASTSSEEAYSAVNKGRLALRVGLWNLMLPMDDVAEIVPFPRITAVPGVKAWLLGIANLRGTVIAVVDLQKYLGEKLTVPTNNSRLIIVRSGEWGYGLLVDEIIGTRNFGRENRVSAFNDINSNLRHYLSEVFESEKKKWLALDVKRLLTDPKFLNATI